MSPGNATKFLYLFLSDDWKLFYNIIVILDGLELQNFFNTLGIQYYQLLRHVGVMLSNVNIIMTNKHI